MPLDTSLYGQIETPKVPTPVETMTSLAQLSKLRDAQRQEFEKRQADEQLKRIFAASTRADGSPDYDRAINSLYSSGFVDQATELQKQVDAHRKTAGESAKLENDLHTAQAELIARALQAVKDERTYQIAIGAVPELAQQLGPQYDPEKVAQALAAGTSVTEYNKQQNALIDRALKGDGYQAVAGMLALAKSPEMWQSALDFGRVYGVPDAQLQQFGEFSPENVQRAGQLGMSPKERADVANAAADNARQDAALAETIGHNRAMERLGAQRAATAAQGASAGSGGGDAQAIADAIASGDQPPEFTGLYRMTGPVRAALARKGYDLTKATEDWKATQKYFQTLNGAQQVRLRQAVGFATDSLDVIDDLNRQWQGGRFPLLNRAQIKAAKGGLLGKQAQQIATQLDAQISDLVSELGTVYKGGNSSTDESLRLATENLKSDWSQAQLESAIKLVRKNLQIRMNSIRNTGIVANQNNEYAPTQGGSTVKPVGRFNPATGKVEAVP